MAFRSSALKNFRFDTRLGPIQTQVLPADDGEFVTRLRSAGHRGVWSRASMPTTTSSPHKRVRSCTPVQGHAPCSAGPLKMTRRKARIEAEPCVGS